MLDTIKKVDVEDGNDIYEPLGSVKNYSSKPIYDNKVEDFDFEFTQPVDAYTNDDVSLDGKYVDENGRSFDANYYYSSDGTYNVEYKDGFKDIKVKFQVDGTMMNLESDYRDSISNTSVKEITNYDVDGSTVKNTYNDDKLVKNEIISRDGTITTTSYSGDVVTREKTINPDGSCIENIYGKDESSGKTVITKDANGNEVKTQFDFSGQKTEEEFKNESGITTEVRSYSNGNLSRVVLNDEFGDMIEDRSYKEGKINEINLSDGRIFNYDENGKLKTLKVRDKFNVQYENGKIRRIIGDNNIDVRYNGDGSLYSVLFDDAEAHKSNISFNVEKGRNTIGQDTSGQKVSGIIKEIVFSKEADGTPSNLIVSTDGQIVSGSVKTDKIDVDVSGLENYLSSFDSYADGYKSV